MSDGQEITCHVCLIATGVAYCKVDIPGADEFTGSGVYYGAALAEAKSCADEIVYIVGGANSAGQAAMYFSRYAGKVHMLVRGDSLTKSMSKYLIDQIAATPNIIVETCTEVVSMSGNGHLECLTLKTPRGEEPRPVTSLFIFIGAAPKTDWLPKEIALDTKGFILAGPDLKTQVSEVLDARSRPLPARNQCPRHLCRRRCPIQLRQTMRLRRRRRLYRNSVRASVSGNTLKGN